jgi:hypothetical protein
LKYENLARDMGVELGGWSFGAQFGDLNNDGYLDLYLTNGYISLSRTKSYWYDFSRVAGGNSKIIADAADWPAFNGRSLSGYQQKKVWINDGAAKFVDVAQAVGATDTYDGRSVALADLWNRGVLDVVVANQRGPLLDLQEHGEARERVGRICARRDQEQPECDRRAGHSLLERAAAGAAGFRRKRVCGAERSQAAFWAGEESADREGSHSLAIGQSPDNREPGPRKALQCQGG